MRTFLFFAAAAMQVMAAPTPLDLVPRAAVSPRVKSVRVIANVTDPRVTRDSCGSTRIGNRAFWTCRDTTNYDLETDQSVMPLVVNTASWSNMTLCKDCPQIGPIIKDGGPKGGASNGSNAIHQMYGGNPTKPPPFFPVVSGECDEFGNCDDGSRWAIWPDSPPMVAHALLDGSVTAYSWIKNCHLSDLTLLNPNPPLTLYRITHNASDDVDALPKVEAVDKDFWSHNQIGFGDYGNVVKDGVAYLYGKTDLKKSTALAKVDVHSIEDKSAYQYYVDGKWTSEMPGINATEAIIPNAGAGGQGTFYWSTHFNSFVWIGQTIYSCSAEFFMTTAPAPEGPWIKPHKIYAGANGDSQQCNSYSLQAHPALLPSYDASENGIYITWTMQFDPKTYGSYVTPLAYVEFDE